MSITTMQYVKKPLYVEAVRITRKNFVEVIEWCEGRVRTERDTHHENPGKKYIKLQTHNPINTRQTKAFVGDWILKTDRGFKVYTHKAFLESFDEVAEMIATKSVDDIAHSALSAMQAYGPNHERLRQADQQPYPREEGDFTVIGPECFAQRDGSVLSWKGTNYVPQDADRRVESEVADFDEDYSSCASPRGQLDPGVPQ